MELDLEQIAILLQRRHGWLREILRLTGEMENAVARHDEVSFGLLLNMRAEEIAKYDAGKEELWSQAEKGRTARDELKRLLQGNPETVEIGSDPMEKKIFEIRKKSIQVIEEIQRREKILSYRVNRGREVEEKK